MFQTTTIRDLCDDLAATRAAVSRHEREGFANYMLGALAHRLAAMPGGPEAWAAALTTARECADQQAALRAASEAEAVVR